MQCEQFKNWLCSTKKLKESTAMSRLSNCKRVEQYEGDLDTHFAQDQLSMLLNKLTYSKEDDRQKLPPYHSIPINGDIYNGTATLHSAITLYQEYKFSYSSRMLKISTTSSSQPRVNNSGNWPEWDIPNADIILKMTKMITPFIRFLHPDIIEAIVSNNEKNKSLWCDKLRNRGINPYFYLWEKSSCVFPGIRRYSGNKEISFYRKRSEKDDFEPDDALALDDNTFPKQIWSFIFRGKKFQNYGPEDYSLAHIADHKDYKNRRDAEFEKIGPAPEKLYGLYTCASNTAYTPTCFIKPTDFNSKVRLLILHKVQNLYGKICNILPPNLLLKKLSPEWDINNFEWAEPVGTKTYITKFLEFRYLTLNSF